MSLNSFNKTAQEAIDAIELLRKQYGDLFNTINATAGKMPQKIENCNYLGQRLNIGYYPRNSGGYSLPTLERKYDDALKHLDELYQKSKEVHEAQIDKLETNKAIRDFIESMMKGFGITTYSHGYYPTNRSKSKKYETKEPAYKEDLHRVLTISDGWSLVETEYSRIKKQLEKDRQKAIKEREDKLAKEQAELLKQKEVAEAISNLTSRGFTAGVDYKIEDALKFWKKVNITPNEYICENVRDIVSYDNRRFQMTDNTFIEEWRWGNTYKATVRDTETDKLYSFTYRSVGEGHGDFEDVNHLTPDQISEVTNEDNKL